MVDLHTKIRASSYFDSIPQPNVDEHYTLKIRRQFGGWIRVDVDCVYARQQIPHGSHLRSAVPSEGSYRLLRDEVEFSHGSKRVTQS